MALSFFQKKKKEKCNRPILGRPTHTDVGLVSFIVFSSSVVVNGGGGRRRGGRNKTSLEQMMEAQLFFFP